jgi:nicotinate-nucleotide pyrophosphorylase (carboxylating)
MTHKHNQFDLDAFIINAFKEDIGNGDHTSLSCIPENAKGKAKLLVKQNGILSGIEIAKRVFFLLDPSIKFEQILSDGAHVNYGDIAFTVEGKSRSILQAERLSLNIMQRMSGIATLTAEYVEIIKDTNAKILDTRKTTPGMRSLEKTAVTHGGGYNHRFGLFDMIMIKDNHIDYAGGIKQAIDKTKKYLSENKLDLKIEVEARNLNEIKEIMAVGGVNRIMIDNFSVDDCKKAVELINGKYETEASGGITKKTIRNYALTGVDFISVGALTHQIKSLDLSLKAY